MGEKNIKKDPNSARLRPLHHPMKITSWFGPRAGLEWDASRPQTGQKSTGLRVASTSSRWDENNRARMSIITTFLDRRGDGWLFSHATEISQNMLAASSFINKRPDQHGTPPPSPAAASPSSPHFPSSSLDSHVSFTSGLFLILSFISSFLVNILSGSSTAFLHLFCKQLFHCFFVQENITRCNLCINKITIPSVYILVQINACLSASKQTVCRLQTLDLRWQRLGLPTVHMSSGIW